MLSKETARKIRIYRNAAEAARKNGKERYALKTEAKAAALEAR